ncbi:MAG: Rrf2 family transcriptional regulator [Bdellovibrionales bacterium]|nr:Rrf2 family transcriptional regulator [Bdellovibrionales bacterium]
MGVTKWGGYGVLCSLYLASRFHRDQEEAIGASEIAEAQLIPVQYTQQILQRLRKGEIIESVRGPKGGYRLTRQPIEITLKEILYAAEGDTFEVICDSGPIYDGLCNQGFVCALKDIWRDLKSSIDQFLDKQTLESLYLRQQQSPAEALANLNNTLVPGPSARTDERDSPQISGKF